MFQVCMHAHRGTQRVQTLPSADQSPMQSESVLQHTHTHCGDTGELQLQHQSVHHVRDTSCKSGITKAFSEPTLKVCGFFAFYLPTWWYRWEVQAGTQINHICQLLTYHHLKPLLIYAAFVSTLFPHSWHFSEMPGSCRQGRSKGGQAGKQNWEALSFPLLFSQVLSFYFSMWMQTRNINHKEMKISIPTLNKFLVSAHFYDLWGRITLDQSLERYSKLGKVHIFYLGSSSVSSIKLMENLHVILRVCRPSFWQWLAIMCYI